MKAFVIKNKEGKYYQSSYYRPNFTDDLFIANKYQSIEETKNVLNKSFTLVDDFEPVEITIEETKEKYFIRDIAVEQLIKENKQLKKERNSLRRKLEQEEKSNTENISDAEEIIEQLKEQLAIREKALQLACKDISLYEDITTADYKAKCYIEQAKENL